MNEYFELVSDDDGHDYVIPYGKRDEWNEFLDDPEMPYIELPVWAVEVNGTLIFSNYVFL